MMHRSTQQEVKMPSLQVRDLPEHIYHKLLSDAKRQHRSLAQQAVFTLSKGLGSTEDPKERRTKLMSRIRSYGFDMEPRSFKNPADMIREDRNR
jgi:hypothetical protein